MSRVYTSINSSKGMFNSMIIPLLFPTVVLIGQKQNLERVYTSINP
jgi:hypothetical protein